MFKHTGRRAHRIVLGERRPSGGRSEAHAQTVSSRHDDPPRRCSAHHGCREGTQARRRSRGARHVRSASAPSPGQLAQTTGARPCARKMAPEMSFWRVLGDPRRRIARCRGRSWCSAVGLRNRRSEVRILSGACWKVHQTEGFSLARLAIAGTTGSLSLGPVPPRCTTNTGITRCPATGLAPSSKLSTIIARSWASSRRLRPQGRQAPRGEGECGGHPVLVRRFRLSPSRFARRGLCGRLRGSPVAAR
jgi:hypothetical protein